MSYEVQSLKRSILTSLEHSQEFLCLSIDATLRVCMTVQKGKQTIERRPKSEMPPASMMSIL